ncbi:MAG: hypothetical protein EOM24_29970, partial [Chloroflexia bacterium]|nr:hypothetical protein [Chloroflexia bacterium]
MSEAVGDPRLLLRQKLKADVEKLKLKERIHTQGLVEAREEIERIERDIPIDQATVKRAEADEKSYLDARDAAEVAQGEAYREALGSYLDNLPLRLSKSDRASLLDHGFGPNHPDQDLAKRVRSAVKDAVKAGIQRPELPTTKPFSAALMGETFTTRDQLTNALNTLSQRMPHDATGWRNVGEVFGFPLEAKQSTRRGEVDLRFASLADPKEVYPIYSTSNSAQAVENVLRSIGVYADNARRRIREGQEDLPKLKAIAETPFARQADLDRKQQRLEEIESDMAINPQPAPAWLRHGAPLDTEVFLKGKPLVVEGHQWASDGYFVLATDGKKAHRVPYLDLRDSNGDRLFEERAFERPEANVEGAAAQAADSEGGDQDVRFSLRTDRARQGAPDRAEPWAAPQQKVSSAATSINEKLLPGTFTNK